MNRKKGILVVSFGTSHPDTRRVTIDAIEDTVRAAYPDIPVYSAWTSRIILRKLAEETGEKRYTVGEALSKMASERITDVYIQPTHVTNGIEYDRMKEDALAYKSAFSAITFGDPLLSSTRDMQSLIRIMTGSFGNLPESEALILMGHGSIHPANAVYAALDRLFGETGFPRIHIGTVEYGPSLKNILELLKEQNVRKIHLAPLMIVAGDHAVNDMAGDGDDSWANICRNAGYEVACHLKGLGEYPEIRQMFLEHLKRCM